MEWTTGRSMHGGRAVAAAALIDDPYDGKKIYLAGRQTHDCKLALDRQHVLAGGIDGNTPLQALSVYDIATNQWEQKAPLPTSRVQHKMVAAGGTQAHVPATRLMLWVRQVSFGSSLGKQMVTNIAKICFTMTH